MRRHRRDLFRRRDEIGDQDHLHPRGARGADSGFGVFEYEAIRRGYAEALRGEEEEIGRRFRVRDLITECERGEAAGKIGEAANRERARRRCRERFRDAASFEGGKQFRRSRFRRDRGEAVVKITAPAFTKFVERERVAEMLTKDTRVKQFRLGAWNEGGAGVTVAEL
jgi:hypothetical protein